VSAPAVAVSDLKVELIRTGDDILDEVSFTIAPGEVLGLVGESGSGKTTAGLALLGHTRRGVRITRGSIHVGELDVLARSASELRALRGGVISYVPQDPAAALNPNIRVGRQLGEVLEAHRFGASDEERQARTAEMLQEVALPGGREFLRRYPHQLSGGQQQRIALAMAFACRPRVIVLDEPTTGLDVTTQAHVLRTVRELCSAHGVAALYVSHALAVVANLADRVALMYAGRIVELGPKRTFFAGSAHPYARGLIDAIPEISGAHALVGIPGGAPRPGTRPPGCHFAPRCTYATAECSTSFPPIVAVSSGHEVRCFHYERVLADARRERARLAGRTRDTTEAALLEVRNLVAFYGDRQVLFGIDLRVDPGECVALVGESGSGKTTLARCIGGLHRKLTGEMLLRGRQLPPGARARDRETRRQIQYIFQSPYGSLNPRKTIGQIIAQPLRIFEGLRGRDSERRVREALDRVALSESVRDRYPDQLSGGERQRVAIARAIAAQPSVLVCDEVTSALDVSVQAAIVELIEELRRELGLGLLFVTHNLALISTIADTVSVMSRGNIVEHGRVRSVLDAPREAYTQELLADTPTVEAAV
jgi:peptide/nickel transport system ATP-binding protein